MEPRASDRSSSPNADDVFPVYNPKNQSNLVVAYPYNRDRCYNDIIIAIVEQMRQDGSQHEVKITARWPTNVEGEKIYSDQKTCGFKLHPEKTKLLLKNVQTTADIMSRMADLAQVQKLNNAERYMTTHDQYLRTLSDFHDVICSQATIVLEILRDIGTKKDRLRQASEASICDTDVTKVSVCHNPESYFPDDPRLSGSEDDIKTVSSVYNHHKQLYLYISSVRAEILNCLTDNRGLSVQAQAFALQSLSATLGPTLSIDRSELRKKTAEAYSVNLVSTLTKHRGRLSGWWCHVSKRYFSPSEVKNAHIIPAATGQCLVRETFGDPEPARILNSQRNFLFMKSTIERVFDEGRISIIPVNSGPQQSDNSRLDGSERNENPTEFQLWFLDRSLVTERKICFSDDAEIVRWSDLAKSPKLEFMNDHARPGLRNLFWHNISSLAKAKQQLFPGYYDALKEFEMIWTPAITNKWIAAPILEGLAAAFRMPELAKPDVYLDKAEVDRLNELYTVANLPWQASCRREDTEDTDSDDEDGDLDFDSDSSEKFEAQSLRDDKLKAEYSFPFLAPLDYSSPRVANFYNNLER